MSINPKDIVKQKQTIKKKSAEPRHARISVLSTESDIMNFGLTKSFVFHQGIVMLSKYA